MNTNFDLKIYKILIYFKIQYIKFKSYLILEFYKFRSTFYFIFKVPIKTHTFPKTLWVRHLTLEWYKNTKHQLYMGFI